MSGGLNAAHADGLTRLHLSESVYGTSPAALAAAAAALTQVSVYPDPARAGVAEAIAAHHKLPVEQVAVANGSDELVLLTSLAVGASDRPGLTTAGTFPGYQTCLETSGRGCTALPLSGGALDVEDFAEALPQHGIGYVCNPHNPSGGVLSRAELDRLVRAAEDSGVPIVFDEAYLDFADPGTPQVRDYLDRGAPIVALRTLSKAYGLAALRIGYAIGAAEQLSALRAAQGTMPFSANTIAQAAAIAALADQDHLAGVRASNVERRSWFCEQLDARGRGWLPSVTNFVAVAVADSRTAQDRLAAEHRILVRDAGLFGFPGHLRVSMGTPAELLRLLDALDAIESVEGK
ncbi:MULTISPECIES: histidinol-phosphate transaminase [unclassified Crossiella]|uniref:pyridoxal phosphate-dependent aminotransferase n=1 Tax=unclassified Crossiella TaxID=2620835 RepID=UPI001FFE915E|nr:MULTISPECIES: histidinol-phosphate transaminase [unclassified Crossiella]MCK2244145.1 histidinol-phosphate aminotransferase family protein [Crossiella sp. S99.2]MCK2257949.1 histidinol-phosphate aminotransferase family protein [Crossiella sp. S99.1]